jgi:8-oxo-dGTP pyrophosphatase MutT (NUDIX family)
VATLEPDEESPRPAATVLLVRDSPGIAEDGVDGALEVLMVQRNAAASFYGGAHVFPGGALDPQDAAPSTFLLADGLTAEESDAALGTQAGGLAYWFAAVRECFEETGLLVAAVSAAQGAGPDPELAMLFAAARQGDGSPAALYSLCRHTHVTFALDQVQYFGHRITPLGRPRRFDTRFFVAHAPVGQVPLADAVEIFDPVWITPEAALKRFAQAEMILAPPTVTCLETIGEYSSAVTLLAAAKEGAAQGVPLLRPR